MIRDLSPTLNHRQHHYYQPGINTQSYAPRDMESVNYHPHHSLTLSSTYPPDSGNIQSSVPLITVKHEHPLIISSPDALSMDSFPGNHCTTGGSITRTGVNMNHSVSSSPVVMGNRTCVPFGYCYDTDDNMIMDDDMTVVVKDEPVDLEYEWMEDSKQMMQSNDLNLWSASALPRNMKHHVKDTGPTLAQLNMIDPHETMDVDELLASSCQQVVQRPPVSRINSSDRYIMSRFRVKQEKENIDASSTPPEELKTTGSNIMTSNNNADLPTQSAVRVANNNCIQLQQPQVKHNHQMTQASSPLINTSPKMIQTLPASQTTACSDEPQSHLPLPPPLIPSPSHPSKKSSKSAVLNSILNVPKVEVKKEPGVPSETKSTKASDNKILDTRLSVPESSPSVSHEKSPTTGTKRKARVRNSSMSTECSVSSHDEGFASQPEDSEDEDDVDSDDESFYGDYEAKDLLGASTSDDKNNRWALNMGRARKGGQQRFFWQYNVQSKGPKGTRISSVDENPPDPHVLTEASDPVFSPDCRVEGVKHAGKARKGDGNDLTPNPRKLLMIGLELKKLSQTINDLTPVSDVPMSARNKTRKEKNKLASRACRLKKKAQHEANKIKLFGLQQEHQKTLNVLQEIKRQVRKNLDNRTKSRPPSFMSILNHAVSQNGPLPSVAGKTADYVNSVCLSHVCSSHTDSCFLSLQVLDKVTTGQLDGGLKTE